ncbi:MAG TPA: molybdopterin-dependent oxidoreductase [Candidatus Polarisedimenticolia bacterium]|nr:molybdopterin-dependent oxidoreductase [Candidatus Polarisedimenticolia bacterium]
MGWRPSLWASVVPRHPGRSKPNHYKEMLRAGWENRDQLPFAWRILSRGVCDGCALGTAGLKDWTLDGVHLCMVRLELMRLNTAPALDPGRLADVSGLRGLTSAALRGLGRLPEPMLRRKGEPGFRVVSWEEALETAAEAIRAAPPERFAVYLTSRGMMNEHYYAAQKAARAMGTNHIDNSARLCHAASTVAMKRALGHGATTCSYTDWIGSDLIVFFGSNTPNNQPVTTKYLYHARRAGTRVAVVNPYFEPGLKSYWIPSVAESALFGTRLADDWFPVHTGGDLAFLTGVFRVLCDEGWVDDAFIRGSTTGFDEARAEAGRIPWERLEADSGASRADMARFAALLRDARTGVLVWSMGLTQHAHGVQTVRALLNVGLARGWVGREKCGLMPIRGHSGVQGGAEVGCSPELADDQRRRFERVWGFPPPVAEGWSASEMIDAAYRGALDVFWMAGGNFLETLPDPGAAARALASVGTRIHQDIVVASMMLVEPKENVLLLPATTRYESPGGGTETSTERRIIYSPEIPGRRIGSARPEWEVFGEVAERVRPDLRGKVKFASSGRIRQELDEAVPLYRGIGALGRRGESVQWGGPRLYSDGVFAVAGGKARFWSPVLPDRMVPAGRFRLSTRRGKQFNSMVQRERDPLTGAVRDEILMAREDAARLGIAAGDRLTLVSPHGRLEGRARPDDVKPGNLEVHWPEGNVLLSRDEVDPASREPDYNTLVRVEVPRSTP